MIHWQRYTRLLATCFAMTLPACASFNTTLARHAIDYNHTIESVSNAQILLNILRARDRRPMYFAAISQVRGSINLGVDASLTSTSAVPLGSSSVTPFLGVTQSSNPSFDLAPQNTQEFIKGMHEPINMELFDYYWAQGRVKEMLLHLFIDKIEFTQEITIENDVERTERVNNYPRDKKDMAQFQKVVEYLLKKKLHPGFVTKIEEEIGPELEKSEGMKLETLVNVNKAGLTLKCGEKCKLVKQTKRFTLCFGKPNPEEPRSCEASSAKGQEPTNKAPGQAQVPWDLKALSVKFGQDAASREGNKDVSIPAGTIMIFYLRSIQDILYYLGEIVRASEQSPDRLVTIRDRAGNREPLFHLVHQPQGPAEAEVVYKEKDDEKKRYVIPLSTPHAARPMDVLSLVSDLIALAQKGETLPKTGTVVVRP